MTFCCDHIKKANEYIDVARNLLNWNNDITAGDGFLGGLTLGMWTTVRLGNNLQEAERQLTKAYRALNDAKREMNACKCFEERNSEAIRREQQTRGAENRIRQLQQDNLEQKLSIKREDLERTIIDLGVSRDNKNEIRRNLCDAYERWLKVMERNGHNERDNCVKRAWESIEVIKDNLSESGISFNNLKRISELCEEIAKLRIQSEQEFVAQIQVPLRQFNLN